MATKSATPPTVGETPEQTALAEATAQVSRLTEARRAAVATVEHLSAVVGPQTQFTARAVEENVQNVEGTRIGRLVAKVLPPTVPSPATPGEVGRARRALPDAQWHLTDIEADLDDAKRAMQAARHALALRQFRDALPGLTVEIDRVLAEVEAVAVKSAAFTTERLLPLLETCPVAGAVAECRLTELEMLRDRAPRLRSLLSALTAQYIPTNGGSA